MSARNFDALFEPRSIALIGANDRPGSVGDVLAANLLAGGFAGPLMFVSPQARTVRGQPVYPSIAALPTAPDLAVIATPAATVAPLIRELGARGGCAAVVISAGFEGDDDASAAARQAWLDAARPHILRIIGPNCLGILSPGQGVNASFARGNPPAGRLALVAQSGAVAAAALDWAPAQGLGFSRVASVGDSLDVDVGDLLDYLAGDTATDAILLYIESLTDASKFMRAARKAALVKPVIAIKGGRSSSGARAAFSHTRALAGADAVYAAAFRRAGILQVDSLEELLDTAALLSSAKGAQPRSLAILTNGGGAGVLAVDALEREGGTLSRLSPQTQAALREFCPANGACGNPVDILGDAGPDLYRRSLDVLLAAPEVEAVLAINCPTAVADSGEAADAVIAAVRNGSAGKPVFAAWLGAVSVEDARRRLIGAGIATYPGPHSAVRSFARLTELAQIRSLLRESPDGDAVVADRAAAARVVATAVADGRTSLDPLEVQAVLLAYGVPTVETRLATSPEAAGQAAAALGGPVALKILSRDISHKSDVGGVRLGLRSAASTRRAAEVMLRRIAREAPDARLAGFTIQPMIDRPQAQELLAGVVRDPTFGAVVMVGHGGTAVEVLADRAVGLPPLNRRWALDMIDRTRVARLLAGYRDRPAADVEAVARVLIALGELASDLPQVAELDLNPLLCDAAGVVAVDARIAVQGVG